MNIQEILELEAHAVQHIPIDQDIYTSVIELVSYKIGRLDNGKIVTTGIGKAGQVAHNLATTFCSTGTPAVFLHPTEARHGDLGILDFNDIIIMFSNSGETEELVELVKIKNLLYERIPIILITSKPDCLLAKSATWILEMGAVYEVCPLGLTPTTSTTVMSVIGDLLVIGMMEKIGFTAEDYYLRHHGGYLGQKAKEHITTKTVVTGKEIQKILDNEQYFRNREIPK